jgi:hypothetical protein
VRAAGKPARYHLFAYTSFGIMFASHPQENLLPVKPAQ